MRMDRERGAAGPAITGFTAEGGFRIDGVAYPAALLTIERAVAWAPPTIDSLDAFAVATALHHNPEFLLLGTGETLRRPPAHFAHTLARQGIGVEVMDSRAAARAWSMLRGEGRRIAAALYPLA